MSRYTYQVHISTNRERLSESVTNSLVSQGLHDEVSSFSKALDNLDSFCERDTKYKNIVLSINKTDKKGRHSIVYERNINPDYSRAEFEKYRIRGTIVSDFQTALRLALQYYTRPLLIYGVNQFNDYVPICKVFKDRCEHMTAKPTTYEGNVYEWDH